MIHLYHCCLFSGYWMTEIFTFSTKLTLLNLCPLSRTWGFQISTWNLPKQRQSHQNDSRVFIIKNNSPSIMLNLIQLVKFHRDLLQWHNILFDFVYYYMLMLALNLLVGPQSRSCWHPNFASPRLHDTGEDSYNLHPSVNRFSATRPHPPATSRSQSP